MLEARSKTFTAGLQRFHYVEWGDRAHPAIILLHGLRAYAHWFAEFAEAAGSSYRLIALDQRGRGDSGWAADGVYTTDAYVADIEALRVHLNLDVMTLVGHSMGGTNAINYTAAYPDRVAALAIVDSAPELDAAGLTRIRGELQRTPKSFESRSDARAFLRTLHSRASDQNIDTRVKWMLRETPDGRIGWRLDDAIFDPRMTPDPPARTWSALSTIKCPTLVVRGELSDLVTLETAQRMVAVMPQSRLAQVNEAGHMVIEDNPAGFNAAVMPFLQEILGTPGVR